MADFNDTPTTRISRLSGRNGRALAASDVALSAGFGDTATVAVATGNSETAFQLTITCGGTGQGASPTATVTFPGGAWRDASGATIVPIATTSRGTGTTQPTIQFQATCTATTCVLTFTGTASGSEVYVVNVRVSA